MTGKASRTATNAIKSATPADDTIAPDLVSTSSDKHESLLRALD
jgi:hypothetical protein